MIDNDRSFKMALHKHTQKYYHDINDTDIPYLPSESMKRYLRKQQFSERSQAMFKRDDSEQVHAMSL